jgi:hypothetical protein
MRSRRLVCLMLMWVACVSGCANVRAQLPQLRTGARAETTAADLHAALSVWATSFQGLVVAACDRIRGASRAREVRRHSLIWQIRMIPLSREAAFRPDPQEAYVAALALSSAQRAYLEGGAGAELFGEQQSIAVAAARQIEANALSVGRAFLTDRQIARLQTQVDQLVAQHPIGGTFAADALLEGFTETSSRAMFAWVVDLPMVPFRALSGVSDTAQAVNAFNETAQEFTDTVGDLPHLTRWQLELLLYDAEELEAVDRALEAAESFADGADRISNVAETLPAELGAELAARLEEARATIAELDSALARAEGLSGPLTHVADRVGDASAQWTALLTEMEQRDEGEPAGRPFDVREYESAAVRIADASKDLRALVAELRELDASRAGLLLDAAFFRAGLLILVFFVALFVYRFAASRLR